MPYVPTQFNEEERRKLDQENPEGVTVLSSQGNTNVAPTAPGVNRVPTSSGRFTNLQKYIDANKNSGFAENVANRLENEVNEASTAANNASQNFRTSVDSSTVRYDDQLGQQVIADPVSVANDASKKASVIQQRDASYKGPSQFVDTEYYQPYEKEYNEAKSVVNASQNESGRFALLDQFYKRPTYSQGEKALDNLVLSNDKKAVEKLGNVAKNFSTVDQPTSLLDTLARYAQQAKATTEATRTQARNTLDTATQQQLAALQTKNASTIQDLDKQYTDLAAALGSRQLTREQADKLGLTGDVYQIYGLDPSTFLQDESTDTNRPTLYQSADADMRARAMALSQLAGQDITGFNPNDGDYAGKAFSFNKDGFETGLKGAQAEAVNAANEASKLKSGPYKGYGIKELTSKVNQLMAEYDAIAEAENIPNRLDGLYRPTVGFLADTPDLKLHKLALQIAEINDLRTTASKTYTQTLNQLSNRLRIT